MSHATLERAAAGPAPLRLGMAVLLFGVPALAFRLSLYSGTHFLLAHGTSQLVAVLLGLGVPAVLLLVTPFVALRIDGYRLSWQVARERFRFARPRGRVWLWSVPAAIVALVASQALTFTAVALVRLPFVAPPSYLSFLNPAGSQAAGSTGALGATTFLGEQLRGNWGIVVAFTIVTVLVVAAEECWWRGYIFPRQERVYGKWTWPVHGTLWALFHFVFYPWNLAIDLVFCNITAFVVQRTRSSWAGVIIHGIYNVVTPLTLLLAAMGVLH